MDFNILKFDWFDHRKLKIYICIRQTIKISLRCKITRKTRNLHSLNTKDIVYVCFDWTYYTMFFLHKTVKRERSRLYCIVYCRIETAFYSPDSVQHSRVSTHICPTYLLVLLHLSMYACESFHSICCLPHVLSTRESTEWYNTFGSWRNVSQNLSHKWNFLRFADFSRKCICVYCVNSIFGKHIACFFWDKKHAQFHQVSGSR